MGQKPDDWHTLSLCRDHHDEQHRIGEQSFEKAHGLNVRSLADEFAHRSPKAFEIKQQKRERGL